MAESKPPFRVLFLCCDDDAARKCRVSQAIFRDPRLRLTTNDKFLEMEYMEVFDAVVLYATVSSDELEMQQDFLDHYLNAPISCLAVDASVADGFKLPDEL
jgi:hypothetical protein